MRSCRSSATGAGIQASGVTTGARNLLLDGHRLRQRRCRGAGLHPAIGGVGRLASSASIVSPFGGTVLIAAAFNAQFVLGAVRQHSSTAFAKIDIVSIGADNVGLEFRDAKRKQ